ncbi:MAG TPA: P1 family peptidase [Thermomicrobiales bacterium]|nr:P1 family peptidase [Thermomicrobiales bacterium]
MNTTQRRRPRLRDLGIAIGTMAPGPLNAITDVPGVRVGHTTVIEGDSVRTGVTAIHPHEGSAFHHHVPAAIDVLNGAGEITGRALVDEYGVLGSPILITNTLSVGEVHRGCVDWLVRQDPSIGPRHWVAPVVAETYDGYLNDCAGQHVTRQHVHAALDGATDGPVAEGCVGGGTGMILFGLKGGIGTSSRMVSVGGSAHGLGVLVQGNCGALADLRVDGVPVGRMLTGVCSARERREQSDGERDGSIIVVIATDAPLSDRQLGRLCRRGMLGLGRVGSTAHHGSGDLLLAFSNAPENRVALESDDLLQRHTQLRDTAINDLFQATVEATEEAVLNAMVAADSMTGRDGHTVQALPHDQLVEIMRGRS